MPHAYRLPWLCQATNSSHVRPRCGARPVLAPDTLWIGVPVRLARQLACWVACALGLLIGKASAEYRFDVWTADSGLPQNSVRAIVQSMDGYLWVATQDGLARFDGVRFTVFNKGNTPGITTNLFISLYEAPDGDLWI